MSPAYTLPGLHCEMSVDCVMVGCATRASRASDRDRRRSIASMRIVLNLVCVRVVKFIYDYRCHAWEREDKHTKFKFPNVLYSIGPMYSKFSMHLNLVPNTNYLLNILNLVLTFRYHVLELNYWVD